MTRSKKKTKSTSKTRKAKRPARRKTPRLAALLKNTVDDRRYVLKLYVAGTTTRSSQAIANIRALCDEHLKGRYKLEVIDVYQQPAEAAAQQIIAAPTLVKSLPTPVRRFVGDLSNYQKILIGLDLQGGKTSWAEA